MRRHVTWIVLLVLAPLSFLIFAQGASALSRAAAGDPPHVEFILLSLLFGVAALVAPVVLLILSIRRGHRIFRLSRRRAGKFTAAENGMLAAQEQASAAWEYARSVRAGLLARAVPGTVQQWDVVPRPSEVFFLRLHLHYARYYGRDVAYTHRSGFAFGHPAFVLGALAVTAAANAGARSAAASEAAPRWRDQQDTIAYVTNQRLVVWVRGAWLSFDYGAIAAVYPEVAARTLVCQFNSTEPLMLAGADAPIAAVFTVLQTYGPDALHGHPSLRPLDEPAPAPALPPLGRGRQD